MMIPTSMLPRPAMRNSRSCTCRSFAKARFTPWGLRKGAMPSNTRNRPSAASRSVRFRDKCSSAGAALAPWCWRRCGRPAEILQVPEEFTIGRDHQQVVVLAERAVVGLQTAVEGKEIGVLRVGVRIDLRGRCVALTADAQRIALGIREDDG